MLVRAPLILVRKLPRSQLRTFIRITCNLVSGLVSNLVNYASELHCHAIALGA
jgi:hypothetical protein